MQDLIDDITSKVDNLSKQPMRIVLVLSNADVMNTFGHEVKASLRTLLLHALPLSAVIVARDIDLSSSELGGSPWFHIFVSVRLGLSRSRLGRKLSI